jgi:D-threo-aldose 1-dehydrogenase
MPSHPIGFGGASVGNLRRATTDVESREAIDRAWQRGIRYFDTAPHYGLGLSEARLGAALAPRDRHDYVLSTKVGRLLKPRPEPLSRDDDGFDVPGDLMRVWDFSLSGVRDSLEQSLGRLGVDHIDILFVHDPDQATPGAAIEGLESLAVLKAEGLVDAIGVGTNSVDGLEDLMSEQLIDVLMLANRWTLLDHVAAQSVMTAAQRHGVQVVAAGVFNSGILARPWPGADARFDYGAVPNEVMGRVRRLADIAHDHGVDLPTAAIAFPLLQPAVVSVVLGMRSASDVDQNVARFETGIPRALWDDLVGAGLVDGAAVASNQG